MKSIETQSRLFPSFGDNVSLLLQEAASIGMWEFEVGNDKVFWSVETKKLHGVAEDYEPSVHQAIKFYKAGDSRNRITKDFELAITQGKEFDSEYLIITTTGKEKWIRSVGVPVIVKGKCVKIYGVFQDIDAQKKAQILLEEQQQRFKRTFENAPNGIALVSLSGDWMEVNSQIYKIFGYTKEELAILNFHKITHPEDLLQDATLNKDLLSGDRDSYQVQRRYIHKTGVTIWTVLSVSLVRTDLESPDYFICQITDITSLKTANQRIEDLLSKTEGQNEKLLNFKHIVSHNLRSHTSNLDMLLGFLKHDFPDLKKLQVFQMLLNAFGDLEKTIESLSEISSFENVSKDDFEQINLALSIEKTIASLSALIENAQCSVQVDIAPHIMVQSIDEYLRSIFLNLMTNAIKYRKDDELLQVKICCVLEGDYIVIHFIDNGLGINLNLHGTKIFGLYKTFHRKPDSRGLGLYIVKNQVEAIGGKVSVDSEVGVGSTFKVYLKV